MTKTLWWWKPDICSNNVLYCWLTKKGIDIKRIFSLCWFTWIWIGVNSEWPTITAVTAFFVVAGRSHHGYVSTSKKMKVFCQQGCQNLSFFVFYIFIALQTCQLIMPLGFRCWVKRLYIFWHVIWQVINNLKICHQYCTSLTQLYRPNVFQLDNCILLVLL